MSALLLLAVSIACAEPVAKDGDDVICAGADLRIEGVNARELDGSCRAAAPCGEMDGERSRAALDRLVAGGFSYTVRYRDPYGRAVIEGRLADGRDLACALIASGAAVRWDRYWPRGKSCAGG
ncbi:MAG TPA: hypothetical protein VEB68_03525 [Croceibacterium sp.]|nr:hypothetical protein [Croceibacterium sp.]